MAITGDVPTSLLAQLSGSLVHVAGADFDRALQSIRARFGAEPVAITVPDAENDPPWRKLKTSNGLVFADTVEVVVVTHPDLDVAPAWSDALHDELNRTSAAKSGVGVVAAAPLSFGSALQHASVGARYGSPAGLRYENTTGSASEAWWMRVAQAADRLPVSMAPTTIRWLIKQDHVQLVLNKGYPRHTPVVEAQGSYQLIDSE